MNVPVDLGWVEVFGLALARMTAFVFIAPPFSYKAFPAPVKAMLGAGLALAVSPRVDAGYERLDAGPFLFALMTELLVGAVLGFLVYVVFSAIQQAGSLVDMFGGFQMAQGFDPQMQINGAQFAKLFQMLALTLTLVTGAYQLIILGVARSYDAIPLGGLFDAGKLAETLTTGVASAFIAAVQIAGPICVILLLADAGLGLLTRVAPSMNAFALGFPLKIFITLSLAGIAIITLPGAVADFAELSVRWMTGIADG